MGTASSGVAIYGPERAQNTKDMAKFSELICFDYNFLPNTKIDLIFWQLIYNFPNLSIAILVNHIIGHECPCHNGQYCRMAIIATIVLYCIVIICFYIQVKNTFITAKEWHPPPPAQEIIQGFSDLIWPISFGLAWRLAVFQFSSLLH